MKKMMFLSLALSVMVAGRAVAADVEHAPRAPHKGIEVAFKGNNHYVKIALPSFRVCHDKCCDAHKRAPHKDKRWCNSHKYNRKHRIAKRACPVCHKPVGRPAPPPSRSRNGRW